MKFGINNKNSKQFLGARAIVRRLRAAGMLAVLAALLFAPGYSFAQTAATDTATAATPTITPNSPLITLNNGKTVPLKELDIYWEFGIPDSSKMQFVSSDPNGWKQKLVDQWTDVTILAEMAVKNNLQDDEEFKALASAVERNLLAQLYQRKFMAAEFDKLTVSQQEIDDFYNKNKEEYFSSAWRDISQIVVKTQKEADALYAKLSAKPAGFAAAAKAKSIDKATGPKGGDFGKITKNSPEAPPEVVTAAMSTPKGKVSKPFQTRNGWTLIYVKAASPQDYTPLDGQITAKISQSLLQEKRKALFEKLLTDIRTQFAPKVDESVQGAVGSAWMNKMQSMQPRQPQQ